MKLPLHGATLEFVQGDITAQKVDAIVNAANSQLAGGGGVDGAIHRAAGPTIMEETRRRYPDGCSTGDAVITTAGHLAAKHIVHTVGPVFRDGQHGEPEKLASAYRRSLEVADQNGCHSIAFPSISTGAYRYPTAQAAEIALRTVGDFLESNSNMKLVRFVLFDRAAFDVYVTMAKKLFS